MFTAFRVKSWNRELVKHKKLSVRAQVKQAEFINATQGECEGRMTRARAAACFPPEENFPPPMTDQELLDFLEADNEPELPEPTSETSNVTEETTPIHTPTPNPPVPMRKRKQPEMPEPVRQQPSRMAKKKLDF